jgi:hypothetical protein
MSESMLKNLGQILSGERSMRQPNSRRAITRDQYDAVLLDLDGVITDTANLHAACWKQMFDEYLQKRATQSGEAFRPFDLATDYRLYVVGSPASMAFATFSHHVVSNSPRERPPTGRNGGRAREPQERLGQRGH